MKFLTNYLNRRSFFANTTLFAVTAIFTTVSAGKLFGFFTKPTGASTIENKLKFVPPAESVRRNTNNSENNQGNAI